MYWQRSVFHIKSPQDILLLKRIYGDIAGELVIKAGSGSYEIEWIDDVFSALENRIMDNTQPPVEYPFRIKCRIVGPQTILNVSLPLEKIDRSTFEHPNKDVLLQWADRIEEEVSYEMKRKYDVGYMFDNPSTPLNNIQEMILACSLTAHVTHVLPTSYGVFAMNKQCVYIPWVSFSVSRCVSGIQLDKDDGFNSCFSDDNSPIIIELNDYFNAWKGMNYTGSLTSHIPFC
jgi:hypothetical protein